MSDNIMRELAKPFPAKFVHTNPSGGGSYIKHHVINQRLIQVLGRPPSFEKVEVIYGDVAAIQPNPSGSSKRAKEGRPELKNVIVAVVGRLTVEIDGHKVIVEEAGDCESPHNWDTDGQRLKDAMSDAYKRCAMRLGVGLHLWSQDEYFLYDKLNQEGGVAGGTPASTPQPQADGEVSGEALAESAQAEPQASLDVSPPDSAEGGGTDNGSSEVWGSASVAPESSTPSAVSDLVAAHGTKTVLLTARRIAKETATEQPLSVEQIPGSLAALVAKELEKVSA